MADIGASKPTDKPDSAFVARPEQDPSTGVQEMDKQRYAPELPAHEGHWGRHELEQVGSIHEMDNGQEAAATSGTAGRRDRTFSWEDQELAA